MLAMEAAPATVPTDAAAPANTGRLPLNSFPRFMAALHKLIDYGQRLATVFQRASHLVDSAEHFLHFGTTDIELILARIRRGLLRAQTLQTMLQNEPTLLKDRLTLYPPPREPGSHPPGPRPAPRHTRAEREAAENQSLLARLPSVAEIAEQIRHRNPGDVLFDICRDLGIMPNHPLYMEISCLALAHGGNTFPVTRLFLGRLRARHRLAQIPPTIAPPPPEPAILATGPP